MKLRKFKKSDIRQVAKVRSSSYKEFNSSEHFKKSARDRYLERTNSNKTDKELLESIRLRKDNIFYVAEENGKIVGYIKGKKEKMGNLFVVGKSHGKGIGKALVEKFENDAKRQGSKVIKLAATLYGTPFYEKMEYKKTTGVRNFKGLKVQPMKKVF
jgi:predicted N-acetyltransferase YhbS